MGGGGSGGKLTSRFHQVSRLRMRGAIPPFHYTSSVFSTYLSSETSYFTNFDFCWPCISVYLSRARDGHL